MYIYFCVFCLFLVLLLTNFSFCVILCLSSFLGGDSINRIGELRKAKGITMKEAARKIGLPYTTYVNYEKNIREPNSETLIELANFYEVSVDYLIGRSDDDKVYFWDKVFALCKEYGISLLAMAHEIGLNNSSITYWKRDSVPNDKILNKLANYFGVSVDYLLDRGPRISPLVSCRRIFKTMKEQNRSLEEMSQLTGISVEEIRSFALGEKIKNGQDCLEKLAESLDVEPAFLLGWTAHPTDDAGYWNIEPDTWATHNNDPDSVRGLQQFAEDEEYLHTLDSVENAKRGLAVIKYLEEMGFIVSGSILKSHFEDQINESGQVIGQSEIADEIGTVLSKDGHTATFTDAEFEELLAAAKEVIEGRFYKKVVEQQNK